MSKRLDCHRPGAIVPSDYGYRLSYALPGSDPLDPAWNLDAARAMCEEIGWGKSRRGTQMFGHIGKCGICGAAYRYGDIWIHVPTGDLVHVGHECADKYEMLAERPGFLAALEAIKRNRAGRIEHERRMVARENFLRQAPAGLAEALTTDHNISRDLDAKLTQWGSLSPKQIDLAFRLQKQAAEPKPAPAPEAPKGEHKGTEGKRETWPLTLVRVVRFGGQFDGDEIRYIWIFQAADGSDLVWFTGNPPCNRPTERDAGNGRVYGGPIPCEVKGTVKRHGDRNGRPQTVLSRVVVKWPAPCPATWEALWDSGHTVKG